HRGHPGGHVARGFLASLAAFLFGRPAPSGPPSREWEDRPGHGIGTTYPVARLAPAPRSGPGDGLDPAVAPEHPSGEGTLLTTQISTSDRSFISSRTGTCSKSAGVAGELGAPLSPSDLAPRGGYFGPQDVTSLPDDHAAIGPEPRWGPT